VVQKIPIYCATFATSARMLASINASAFKFFADVVRDAVQEIDIAREQGRASSKTLSAHFPSNHHSSGH